MTMVGLPMILFQVEAEDEMGGDLEYLSRIANGELTSGVLKNFSDESESLGTIIIATVPTGKDWYLMGWSCVTPGVAGGEIHLEFPENNQVDQSEPADTDGPWIYNGIAKGNKAVAGDDIIQIRVGGGNFSGVTNLFILEVDTGVSPKLT